MRSFQALLINRVVNMAQAERPALLFEMIGKFCD